MIQKSEENVEGEDGEVKVARIKSIASKRKVLEEESSRVQREIRSRFSEMLQTVRAREKQLLRQAEAIYRQQTSVAESSEEVDPVSVCVLFDETEKLFERIRTFGRIDLSGSDSLRITSSEPYRIAEYQDLDRDHVSFNKFIADNSLDGERLTDPGDRNRDENGETPNESLLLEGANTTVLSIEYGDAEQYEGDGGGKGRKGAREKEHKGSNGAVVAAAAAATATSAGERTDQEEQRRSSSSGGHPEQVQQWLEEILRETEIEPTIHEVEMLPEICYWRKLHQVES